MYKWTCPEVLSLLGIQYKLNRPENVIPCPFCGGKRFAMNIQKGIGHCFNCSATADSAAYYAQSTGQTLHEGRKDIESRLNIKDDTPRPDRIVYSNETTEEDLASETNLNLAYSAFLSELMLSNENRDNLLARGFNMSTIDMLGYKTFPRKNEIDYIALCKRLQQNQVSLKGIPGFYKAKYGDYSFVQLTKGIIMPIRNIHNEIIGLQIRKDDDKLVYLPDEGKLEAKCSWFSSKGFPHGTSAHGWVHYATDFRFDGNKTKKWWAVVGDTVILTEGAMKADLIHLLSCVPTIAVPGVNNIVHLSKELTLLRKLGVKKILHCYDMDYKTNPNVANAMKKTKTLIEESGLEYQFCEWETKVNVAGEYKEVLKGLDDYLAYIYKGIVPKVQKN